MISTQKNRIVYRGSFNSATRNNFANQVLHDLNLLSNTFLSQEVEESSNLEISLRESEEISNKIKKIEDITKSIISNL